MGGDIGTLIDWTRLSSRALGNLDRVRICNNHSPVFLGGLSIQTSRRTHTSLCPRSEIPTSSRRRPGTGCNARSSASSKTQICLRAKRSNLWTLNSCRKKSAGRCRPCSNPTSCAGATISSASDWPDGARRTSSPPSPGNGSAGINSRCSLSPRSVWLPSCSRPNAT